MRRKDVGKDQWAVGREVGTIEVTKKLKPNEGEEGCGGSSTSLKR